MDNNMAGMNMFIMQGTIPSFEHAVRAYNIDNENTARVHLKLSVDLTEKDENGYVKREIHDFVAFRKTAQNLAKLAKPGTGFIFHGRVSPSTPRMQNGSPVLDAEGKKVYNPPSLIVDRFYFQKSNPKMENGSSGAKTPTEVIDPMNYNFGAGNTNGSSDDFAFGEGFEFGGTSVDMKDLPF